MPHYKLTYFDMKTLGEPIRFLLSYMGKEFEDNRISLEQWQELKDQTPFRKLPTLEIDGKVLYQSTAILRYLAQEAGLAGDNLEEKLEVDMIAGEFGDIIQDIIRFYKMEISTEEKLKLTHESIDFYMPKFEKVLKKNGGYLANGKLSWVDLYVVAYSSSFPNIIKLDLNEKYPFFKEYSDRIHSLPGIKEWVEKRPVGI